MRLVDLIGLAAAAALVHALVLLARRALRRTIWPDARAAEVGRVEVTALGRRAARPDSALLDAMTAIARAVSRTGADGSVLMTVASGAAGSRGAELEAIVDLQPGRTPRLVIVGVTGGAARTLRDACADLASAMVTAGGPRSVARVSSESLSAAIREIAPTRVLCGRVLIGWACSAHRVQVVGGQIDLVGGVELVAIDRPAMILRPQAARGHDARG